MGVTAGGKEYRHNLCGDMMTVTEAGGVTFACCG
ncbi:MAG: desulforedoxin [Dehalococcoidia bacterium]|jgi:hypothetical protein|nr:desulforedoxin [Dehalococcoidia bacterium]MDP7240667.1 desulforedoxin [Dehalococcoidia bacterium]